MQTRCQLAQSPARLSNAVLSRVESSHALMCQLSAFWCILRMRVRACVLACVYLRLAVFLCAGTQRFTFSVVFCSAQCACSHVSMVCLIVRMRDPDRPLSWRHAVQEVGGSFVSGIKGDYFNVSDTHFA